MARFDNLTYDSFRAFAGDDAMSLHEKIGFPNEYRAGKTATIIADIAQKLPAFFQPGAMAADIGCGCGALARSAVRRCAARRVKLYLVDSAEMLAQFPAPRAKKIRGRFPKQCAAFLRQYRGRMDAVLCYSVLQYAAQEGYATPFFDATLSLLAPGGAALFGDIPNVSMRNRFFLSEAGRRAHRAFIGKDSPPPLQSERGRGRINDGAVLNLVRRARRAEFHCFILPQKAALPMSNRREDLLVVRP